MKNRVTGLGGFFFKTKDPDKIKEWYKNRLGLNTDQYGCTFWWKDKEGNDCSTQWSPFKEDTTYFKPSEKQFMMNFRVENLVELLAHMRASGVQTMAQARGVLREQVEDDALAERLENVVSEIVSK